jgi:hypothetical protein
MALLREGLFVYGQANGALTQYDAVKVDNDGQIVQLTTTVSGAEPTAAGATQQSGFSDNYYGWVWRGLGGGSGLGIKVNALTLCATDVKLYTTATAGAIDDSATDCIQGLTLVSTNAAGGTVATECYSSIPCATNSET